MIPLLESCFSPEEGVIRLQFHWESFHVCLEEPRTIVHIFGRVYRNCTNAKALVVHQSARRHRTSDEWHSGSFVLCGQGQPSIYPGERAERLHEELDNSVFLGTQRPGLFECLYKIRQKLLPSVRKLSMDTYLHISNVCDRISDMGYCSEDSGFHASCLWLHLANCLVSSTKSKSRSAEPNFCAHKKWPNEAKLFFDQGVRFIGSVSTACR